MKKLKEFFKVRGKHSEFKNEYEEDQPDLS